MSVCGRKGAAIRREGSKLEGATGARRVGANGAALESKVGGHHGVFMGGRGTGLPCLHMLAWQLASKPEAERRRAAIVELGRPAESDNTC